MRLLRVIFTFTIIFLCFQMLFSDSNRRVVPDLLKPEALLVKNNRLYVLERTTIHIFDLDPLRHFRSFGREGEGPTEFMVQPFGPPMTISFREDQLVVNSNNKMSYFSLSGDYLREEKAPPGAVFFRIRGGYLGIGSAIASDGRQRVCYRVFDEQYQNPRALYESEVMLNQVSEILLPMNALNYYPITDDEIYIVNGRKGFVIECYSHSGEKKFSIQHHPDEKRRVTEAYRSRTMEWFKTHPIFGPQYEAMKEVIKFKADFPAIRTIAIDGDRIYVITHIQKNGLNRCLMFDKKGNLLNRYLVPLQESEPYTYYPTLMTVSEGVFHALLEDPEEETWSLHSQTLQ